MKTTLAPSNRTETPPQLVGLASAQAEANLRLHGENVLTPPARDPWWKLFLQKFDDPVIRILMVAAFVAIGVGIADGKYIEGIGILCAILLSTGIAFFNEYRAAQEFDLLNKVTDDVEVQVLRDGQHTSVPRRLVTMDDLVLIEAGQEIPADGEIVEAMNLQIDQSRLTGETVPANKRPLASGEKPDDHEAYPAHRVLRSTMVSDGHGVMRVTAVGNATEIGQTARAAAEETGEITPLNQQLHGLAKVIGVIGFGAAAALFIALNVRAAVNGEIALSAGQWTFAAILFSSVLLALGRVWLPILQDAATLVKRPFDIPGPLGDESWKGWIACLLSGAVLFGALAGSGLAFGFIPSSPEQWLTPAAGSEFLVYFMVAITVIVVAVPEGLSMSVTLSLAYSMRKMTAANNLVRKLHACETIGAATVICSDKTGTLTQNRMTVREIIAPAGVTARALLADAFAANTTANLGHTPSGEILPLGNPTECALLAWLEKEKTSYTDLRARFAVENQLTFSTERKYMGTLGLSNATGAPLRTLHIKGAPEIVLEKCTRLLSDSGEPVPFSNKDADSLRQHMKSFQKRGMRTLGFAYSHLPAVPGQEAAEIPDLASNLVWLGFAAIEDPVRPDVPDAIRDCRNAGISVKIVTGDVSETAAEIGRQIGLLDGEPKPGEVMTGTEFSALSDDAARKEVKVLRVMSRARPMDKMRLVRLLKESGEVVAVTGDGTNDAPALNYSDVGLSMGKAGTAVAKEASDIVLLDDSFKSIVNGVLWGRSLYQNIQRFLIFQLIINVTAITLALAGPFIGIKVPLTVTQMLWVNLIMDTFAALALATEPANPAVLRNKPRRKDAFIVTPGMAVAIFTTGAAFVALSLGLIGWLGIQKTDGHGEIKPEQIHALTLFFTAFVLAQFWNLFNARAYGSGRSALAGLGGNPWFIGIAILILIGQYCVVTYGGSVFRTVPLTWTEWGILLAATSPVLIIGEIIRLITNKRPATR